jgi:hypothetical protein
MSSVVISGDSSGTVSLTVPSVAGTNTATLPAATGTVMVSGNMPTFAAYVNGSQTITGSVNTKVQFDGETFDTANCYDPTTNYRFTPNVAGYYQINASVMMANTTGQLQVMIYKNGSNYSRGGFAIASATGYPNAVACNVIYCNGSTDYIEIYTYFSTTSAVGGGALGSSTAYSSFSGALIRTA